MSDPLTTGSAGDPKPNHAPTRTDASDIRADSWVDRWLPPAWRPFARLARLDRPIGTWLLLFPCWWGLTLASPDPWPDPWAALLFFVGALAMRGAGCSYNDILDRKIDAGVARTASRPIPSGAVTVKAAIVFLLAQLAIGAIILFQFDPFSIGLGIAALLPVAIYPLMKRVTYWPQAFLGLTFNWGALLGVSVAQGGNLPAEAIALYLGGIAWTLHYDTIYAHQDKEDDALIGVKSTALKFGSRAPHWLTFFALVATALWAVAFLLAGIGWLGFLALGAALAFFVWQAWRIDYGDPGACLAGFRAHRWIGWLILVGLLADKLAARTVGG